MTAVMLKKNPNTRRSFLGGSDARIIMGDDEPALLRLWRRSAARSSRRTCPTF